MSDKSFTDHANKNIVKNPLLSTAVTGLSIEDLTHNAVLLPAAPTQAIITRSDQIQTHAQNLARPHDSNQTLNLESNSNQPPSITANDTQKKDDFDVTEYFERLQGTRYISAPYRSQSIIDQNANLEENLEEVSLTEEPEIQQSLTADIAQNFSQLPTVLPHVASAVFSSFSNMLSLKREVVEERVQKIAQDEGVVLMGVEPPVREVAPPPKEPPMAGPANYRITSKKKYAQIPGLSSGEMHTPSSIPVQHTTPSYFIPSYDNTISTSDSTSDNIDDTQSVTSAEIIQKAKPPDNFQIVKNPAPNIIETSSEVRPNLLCTARGPERNFFEQTVQPSNLNQTNVIPPPPMFSALKSDTPPSAKPVLPPSVARRIGSNHPVIKQQTVASAVIENIFVPTFDPSPSQELSQATNIPSIPKQTVFSSDNYQSAAFSALSSNQATFTMPPPIQEISSPVLQGSIPKSAVFSSNNHQSSAPMYLPVSSQAPLPMPPLQQISSPMAQGIQQYPPQVNLPSNSIPIFTPTMPVADNAKSTLPPRVPASSIVAPSLTSPQSMDTQLAESSLSSSIPLASSNITSLPPSNIPPTLFNPMTSQAANPTTFFAPPQIEQSKPLAEPPKASGTVNYRMTKKRPQYYSGPIEGVGSISNNTKPIIPSVETGTFQGALFTPAQPEVPSSATMPFDISQGVQPTIPLDSSKSIEQTGQYDTNRAYEPNIQPQFDTAFDFSRPTTENYNAPCNYETKESKGFGIIGSLKSKLSSIDINKIQNTVTTFFDPAYNENKEEKFFAHETALNPQPNQQFQQQGGFEIFVPSVPQDTQAYSSYNYQDNQSNYYQDNSYYSNQYNYYQQPSTQSQLVPSIESAFISQEITQTNLPVQPSSSLAKQFISSPLAASVPAPIQQPSTTSNITIPLSTLETSQALVPPSNDTSNIASAASLLSPLEPTENVQSTPIFYNPGEFKNDIKESITNIFNPPVTFNEGTFTDTRENSRDTGRPEIINQSVKILAKSESAGGDNILKSFSNASEYKQDIRTNIFSGIICNVDSAAPESMQNTQNSDSSNIAYSAASFFDTQPAFSQTIDSSFSKSMDADKSQLPLTTNRDMREQSVKSIDSFKSDYFYQNNHVSSLVTGSLTSQSTITDGKEKRLDVRSEITQELPKSDSLLESISKNQLPIVGVSSVPLFGLSTIIADTSAELRDANSEITTKHLEEMINKNASISFFENNSMQESPVEDSELNICETCREVKRPDDYDENEVDDLTTQLIENITSPIQLSNPVEVPLTETKEVLNEKTLKDNIEFSDNQFIEISHITEETIDTINVQSAAELLEDVEELKPTNYGWSTDENFTTSKFAADTLLEHDYSFKIDPDSIGFHGHNSFFFDNIAAEASEEVKKELKHNEDLHQEQMSIPSAPPAEDDAKSDETGGLDVHSIELDAKNDFPVYEEFVIEPSENDDDKVGYEEHEKTTEPPETFTDRIAKYKEMEKVGNDEQKSNIFGLSSPPITMASYFDTGNFAVETHYRNSISSPSQINIPPGFEDEFQSRLGIAKTLEDLKTVPDTSTQTRTTSALTYSTVQHFAPVGFNVETNITKLVEDTTENLPDFTTDLDANLDTSRVDDKLPDITKCTKIEDNAQKLPDLSSVFESKTEPDRPEIPKLPDPINFFSSGDTPETPAFNRLASYFASPPKTDHGKSFFELSQSQNHYRHASNVGLDNYSELIKDLTSVQNINAPKDQTIRHVNYFTVEYDTDYIKEFNRESKNELVELNVDESIEGVFGQCKLCCNALNLKGDYSFKKAMNDSSEATRGSSVNMGSKDTPNKSVSINLDNVSFDQEGNDGVHVLTEGRSSAEYTPVRFHWFYRVDIEDKSIWRGFSVVDSAALETAFHRPDLNETTVVATDGGRYDVNVVGRLRIPVYWDDKPTNVRRCSWFYRGQTDARYVPYTENVAEKLEEEYRNGVVRGEWHRRLTLPNGEAVVMHGPGVMVHFLQGGAADALSTAPIFPFGKRVYRNPPKVTVSKDQPQKIDHLLFFVHGAGEYRHQREKRISTSRPRVVRRGHDESEIEDTEPSSIDHLLLLCHGVGSACDMRFRSVEEVVEDFRATSLQLLQSHYRNSYDRGVVSRIEVLPISWHASLHSGETGVDRRLAQITLASIPRLRHFTNDTILDVLFYTSPVYCQSILNTVCNELNRIYKIFVQRNPDFKGGVSLGGHSLGSVILYDLLCNQTSQATTGESKSAKTYVDGTPENRTKYPELSFSPDSLYALGSPIAIFECIRGVESLGLNFKLPTCRKFFNIFHPYDPIAYRIEPLVNTQLRDLKPYLIPHHKGRKRMHLELKDTMARVGADLKQKLMESLRTTWNKLTTQPTATGLPNVMEEEMEKEQLNEQSSEESAVESELATPEMLGRLNGGRRIDYVLQEAPLEMINEYIFAMSSHVGYWESEDTMLLMLREIYGEMGVQPDCTVPQQTLSVQRARTPRQDETIIVTTADYPSTSHGTT